MSRDDCLVYVPLPQRYLPNLLLVARTNGNASDAAATLQTLARRVDPELSTGTAGPAEWLAAGPWVAARAGGAVAAGLGLLTLALAMVGLYGVQSQLATHRTREVGIRMALGAAAASVQRMMVRDGFRPVLEGFAAGLALGTIARGALRATIVGDVALVDPLALVIVPIPLALAAFAACYAPARRAARLDPSIALRHE
jgi:putative ABC transport system permease protein